MPQDVIGSAWVEINSNIKELQRDIAGIKSHVDASAKNIETRFNSATKAIAGLGAVIGTIGIIKFGSDVFSASLKMENLNKMLKALEGSQTKATATLKEYIKWAKDPGLNLTQITMGMTHLKLLHVDIKEAEKLVRSLGNAVTLAGGSAEMFGRVMIQIEQSFGKGRVMAEDLRVIAESFPMIRSMMQTAFGTVDTDKLEKMGITAKEFWLGIRQEMEKMPKAIGGTQNSIDNFKDSLLQFESALGKNILPQIGKLLDFATKLMDNFNKLPEPVKNLTGTFAIGGMGLLGTAFALSLIVEHGGRAIGVLKGLAGAQALAGAGGITGGVIKGLGTTGSGVAIGGGALAATAAVGAAAIATTWAAREVYISATRVDLIGPMSTAGAKAEIAKSRGALKTELGLYNPTEQLSTQLAKGDLVKMDRLFKEAGLDMSRYIFMTFDQALDSINLTWANATGGKRQPKYRTTPLNITNPELLPKIKEIETPVLERIEDYYKVMGAFESPERAETKRITPPSAKVSTQYWEQLKPIMDAANKAQKEWNKTVDEQSLKEMVLIETFIKLDEKEQANIDNLKTQKNLFTDMGVPLDDYNKSLEFMAQIPVWEAINKQNKELTEQLLNIYDVTSAWKDLKDEMDIAPIIEKADKKQSQFWQDMKYMGLDAMDAIIDKGIYQLFDNFFANTQNAIEAWNEFGYKSGETWERFSKYWNESLEKQKFVWHDFLKDLLIEFGKMLTKKLIMYGAEKVAEWAIDRMTGSKTNNEKNYEDWYTPESPALSDINLGTKSKYTGNIISNYGEVEKHWYGNRTVGESTSLGYDIAHLWGVLGYQHGGWALKPTMAILAENEPELVIPKSKLRGLGGSTVVNISFPNADPDRMDKGRFKHLITTSLRELAADGVINKAVI